MIPKVSMGLRSVLPLQTCSSIMDLALWKVPSYVGTGRGHRQIVPTKLGVWSCPKCSFGQFLNSLKTTPHHQTLHLTHCTQRSTVLLQTAKTRLTHHIVRQRNLIHHSREHVCTALESSDGVLYSLHPTLCILHCQGCIKNVMKFLKPAF